MDPVYTALANIGGVGILAACLLFLHREALKGFREEMEKERCAHSEQIKLEREQCHEDHEKLMEAVNKNTSSLNENTKVINALVNKNNRR